MARSVSPTSGVTQPTARRAREGKVTSDRKIHGKLHDLTDALRAAMQVIADIEHELVQTAPEAGPRGVAYPAPEVSGFTPGQPTAPVYPHVPHAVADAEETDGADETQPPEHGQPFRPIFTLPGDARATVGGPEGASGASSPPMPPEGWPQPPWAYLPGPWAWQGASMWWPAMFAGWPLGAPPWASALYPWGMGQGVPPGMFAPWAPNGFPWWAFAPAAWPARAPWADPQRHASPDGDGGAPEAPAPDPREAIDDGAASPGASDDARERTASAPAPPPSSDDPRAVPGRDPLPGRAPTDERTWRWSIPEDVTRAAPRFDPDR